MIFYFLKEIQTVILFVLNDNKSIFSLSIITFISVLSPDSLRRCVDAPTPTGVFAHATREILHRETCGPTKERGK